MTPINFAGFRFGLEGRKALNLTKVGLELLEQLEIDITVLKTGRRFANEMKLLKNFHVDENKDEEKRLEYYEI